MRLAVFALFCCIYTPLKAQVSPELKSKIGQLILVGFRGTEIDEQSPIYTSITKNNIGGVVLYDSDIKTGSKTRNIESPEQIARLTKQLQSIASTPLFIAVDQEGGKVARLKPTRGFPATLSHLELGKKNDLNLTRKEASTIAKTLSDAGINMNFAPTLDVLLNIRSTIIAQLFRSFSSDPTTVYQHAKSFITAHKEEGVLNAVKHFPGYGSESGTRHRGVVDVSPTWDKSELKPYQLLIENGMLDVVMVSHVYNKSWDTEYPASLSKKVVSGLLREELGFEGVIIGESPQANFIIDNYGFEESIRLQMLAGVDMLQFANNLIYDENIVPNTIEIISKMIENGELTEERILDSYNRIQALKSKL